MHGYREIISAILYVVRAGCAWRLLPHDLSPWQMVYGQFRRWTKAGTWTALHDHLREQVRIAEGKKPTPTASIIDAQSVREADTVGSSSRGYDAGKKTNGRKRHNRRGYLGSPPRDHGDACKCARSSRRQVHTKVLVRGYFIRRFWELFSIC
jgi:transposase